MTAYLLSLSDSKICQANPVLMWLAWRQVDAGE